MCHGSTQYKTICCPTALGPIDFQPIQGILPTTPHLALQLLKLATKRRILMSLPIQITLSVALPTGSSCHGSAACCHGSGSCCHGSNAVHPFIEDSPSAHLLPKVFILLLFLPRLLTSLPDAFKDAKNCIVTLCPTHGQAAVQPE